MGGAEVTHRGKDDITTGRALISEMIWKKGVAV
jgi:hypothetical protein